MSTGSPRGFAGIIGNRNFTGLGPIGEFVKDETSSFPSSSRDRVLYFLNCRLNDWFGDRESR
jgi:hypothetical protein